VRNHLYPALQVRIIRLGIAPQNISMHNDPMRLINEKIYQKSRHAPRVTISGVIPYIMHCRNHAKSACDRNDQIQPNNTFRKKVDDIRAQGTNLAAEKKDKIRVPQATMPRPIHQLQIDRGVKKFCIVRKISIGRDHRNTGSLAQRICVFDTVILNSWCNQYYMHRTLLKYIPVERSLDALLRDAENLRS
jgi:hypothetical protein